MDDAEIASNITADDLLPDIWYLILRGGTSNPGALPPTDFQRLQRLLDRALSLATPSDELDAGLASNLSPKPSPLDLVGAIDADLANPETEQTTQTPLGTALSPSDRGFGQRMDMPLLSLLWFWKGWSLHALDSDQAPLTHPSGTDKPVRNFEAIEDAYVRAIKACAKNDAPVIMLAYLYWMQTRRDFLLSLLAEFGAEDLDDVRRMSEDHPEAARNLLRRSYDEATYAELDYTEARRTLRAWDADPNGGPCIFYFEYAEYLPFAEYTGWIPFVLQMGKDLWGKNYRGEYKLASWIYTLALCWQDFPINDTNWAEQIHYLRISLDLLKEFPDGSYSFVPVAKLELAALLTEKNGCDTGEALSLFENVYRQMKLHGKWLFPDLPYRYFKPFLVDSPQARNSERVAAIIADLLERGLLPQDPEKPDEDQAYLLDLYSEHLRNKEAYELAHKYLRLAFDTFGGNERAGLLVDMCIFDLDRLQEARQILASLPAPTPDLRRKQRWVQKATSTSELVDLFRSFAAQQSNSAERVSQGIIEIKKQNERVLAQSNQLLTGYERVLTGFKKSDIDDKSLACLQSLLSAETRWLTDLFNKHAATLAAAPPDYRNALVQSELLYHTLRSNGVLDFTPAILVWWKLIKQALRDGLLLPFARWLDARRHVEPIALHRVHELERSASGWERTFAREVPAD
jgi:hypothetical protein